MAGLSPILRNATLSFLANDVCNATTQADAQGQIIKPSMLCAASGASSTCLGDSGGPLLYSPCKFQAWHLYVLPCLGTITLYALLKQNEAVPS